MPEERVGATRPVRAAVTEANHFQFAPGDELAVTHFASRTLLWGIAGSGTVRCQDADIVIGPGDVVLFPWASAVRYRAAPAGPFLIGTVHLVPSPEDGDPVVARSADRATGGLYRAAHRRRPDGWSAASRPLVFAGVQASRLIRLAEAATDYFLADQPDDEGMRALGHLFERALVETPTAATSAAVPVPPILAAMQEFARNRLGHPLTTTDLANLVSCSLSTAERQFRRYTGLSPRAWLREERLRAAGRLLRTTSLRVADVATACGFQDPHYFTRAFRERFGVPPRTYAHRP